MPSINFPIGPHGPTLEIGISAPESLQAAGSPPAQKFWFKATADTGCSHTAIHSSVAQKCGLAVLSKTLVATTSGNVTVNVYHGDLYLRSLVAWTLPFEYVFNDQPLSEMLNANPNFDALLGMNILSQGTFVLNGGFKQATFSW
jgi:hypothetical protein